MHIASELPRRNCSFFILVFVSLLCLSAMNTVSAKLGETLPQLVKRFGNEYTVEGTEESNDLRYRFRLKDYAVDATLSRKDGELVSILEAYYSEKPLLANGSPPASVVKGIMAITAPNAKWVKKKPMGPQQTAFVTQDGATEAAILPPAVSIDPQTTFTVVVARLKAVPYKTNPNPPVEPLADKSASLSGDRFDQGREQPLTCQYFDHTLGVWDTRPLLIEMDKDGAMHLSMGRESFWAHSSVSVGACTNAITQLTKSIEWGEKAAAEKVELKKSLGSPLDYGVWLTFFSASRGQQTDVILHLHDIRSWVRDNNAYLDRNQVRAFIAYLKRAPAIYEEKKQSQAKESEFR